MILTEKFNARMEFCLYKQLKNRESEKYLVFYEARNF